MKLNQREILRYLGYGPNDHVEDNVKALIEESTDQLCGIVEPKYVYRIFPIVQIDEKRIDFGFVQIYSQNLAKNLHGCKEAVFLAATLGSAVDQMLNKYSRIEMSRAVVLNAIAVEAIEKYCDRCEEEIKSRISENVYFRPRFSPGYGDFELEFQKKLIQILEAPKKAGITLTESCLMMPSKSVTAIIGIGKEPYNCKMGHKCETCTKEDCAYRRK